MQYMPRSGGAGPQASSSAIWILPIGNPNVNLNDSHPSSRFTFSESSPKVSPNAPI